MALDVPATVVSETPHLGLGTGAVGAPSAQESEPQHDQSDSEPTLLDLESKGAELTDATPTKRYQALLLLAGFTMLFHVIGINQTFGVFQEYYTSSASNVPDAIGQDALVSLVGVIGAGLTYAGSIFVNPWMAHIQEVRIISLLGVILMSLGILLASFNTMTNTRTCMHPTMHECFDDV
ncbi:hypothetical protein J3R82DRAFT_87 [Butyriboletus roseoflavus]|nr:hypothetical protein J3R82DRAFT_87 [Butyriboletus roseoflavus]